MVRAMLLTMTLLTCVVVALGCDRAREVAPSTPKARGETVMGTPGQTTKAPEAGPPKPMAPPVSPPVHKEALEAPVTEPPPRPPARPPRPRAPHTDRCGRPLLT